ncbi:hypothetical protein [Actinophytocola xanthii]|uniref:Uncharacterized protein n=1 Tax=Actinophytocola xanthii TaxID=1912961 RepID=A0A1Q8CW15_9PSEU|nr:hypothetical protein [Actinophytocola xanthii]OLF18522.1 hypothetical protein BU204_06110 [Actinophytocola xanthii]
MSADSDDARPGLAPGVRSPVGTLFAAVYGGFASHPWQDQDAYSLFHQRSLAMRWLDDIGWVVRRSAAGYEERPTGAAGLWGMNDAGRDRPAAAGAAPVAWFQVGAEPVPAERPLPVQPFLRCVEEVVARLGKLELDAVQVLVPVQGLDVSSRPEPALAPSLLTAGWFGGDGRARTPVRVTLDSGRSPAVPAVAARLREWVGRLDQEVFACDSHSADDHASLAASPPFDDRLWYGPAGHRATFHGTLAEWSLDALGWLGAFLADLSAREGVTTPLLLTVDRP